MRRLPDHGLIDRLVRGRAWIPVLGVLLAGIVAMQVELLKLNSSIGRSIDRGAALQSKNEQLRASVATLADGQRIERLAARMGMVMADPGGAVFLTAAPGGDVDQAVARMHSPDASAIATLQSAAANSAATADASPATSATGGSVAATSDTSDTSSGTSTGATGDTGATGSTGDTTTGAPTPAVAPAASGTTTSTSNTSPATGAGTATSGGAAAATPVGSGAPAATAQSQPPTGSTGG